MNNGRSRQPGDAGPDPVHLVDNACKYASTATDKRLHIIVELGGATVQVPSEIHGRLARDPARRLFRPFSKSPTKPNPHQVSA